MEGMINTFVPMIEQFYNQMDHEQSMADFQKDMNGDGLLTESDDAACQTKLTDHIMEKLRSMNVPDMPDDMAQQMESMKSMSSALGKEMFDKFIDSNNDGAASLEEI